jgi:hypothetical protein
MRTQHITTLLSVSILCLALTACAPATTIEPQELVVNMNFNEAFAAVTQAITTQPYPSNKGGWVMMASDQVGGFIRAEMNYVTTGFAAFMAGPIAVVERVSVAINQRGPNQTAVNISRSAGDEASALAAAIARAVTNR